MNNNPMLNDLENLITEIKKNLKFIVPITIVIILVTLFKTTLLVFTKL